MNKKALLNNYSKKYTYIIKEAYKPFFNRNVVPRGSAISRGLAHKAWQIRNDAWDSYNRNVNINGMSPENAAQMRRDYIDREMRDLAYKYTPNRDPRWDYRFTLGNAYRDNIGTLRRYLQETSPSEGLTPQEFAQRILAYQRYNGNADVGGSLSTVARKQLQGENSREFFLRNFDPRWQPYLRGTRFHIYKSGFGDNGSASPYNADTTLKFLRSRQINPTIIGHELPHVSYRLEDSSAANPNVFAENSVAPLFGKEPVGPSGFLTGIDESRKLTLPNGQVMGAKEVRWIDESRANRMQVEAVDRAIAEGLQNGTMTPRQARMLKYVSDTTAANSNNSYRHALLDEPRIEPTRFTTRELQNAQRVINADNAAHQVNVKKILGTEPADRLWNKDYNNNGDTNGIWFTGLGPAQKIHTIDAVLADIDSELHYLQRNMANSTGSDAARLASDISRLEVNKQWLIDNRDAVQQAMSDIRRANRIEGKGIALQNEMARLRKQLPQPAKPAEPAEPAKPVFGTDRPRNPNLMEFLRKKLEEGAPTGDGTKTTFIDLLRRKATEGYITGRDALRRLSDIAKQKAAPLVNNVKKRLTDAGILRDPKGVADESIMGFLRRKLRENTATMGKRTLRGWVEAIRGKLFPRPASEVPPGAAPEEPESPWFALGKRIGRLGKTIERKGAPVVSTAKKKLTDAGILKDPNAVDPAPEEPESPWFALGKALRKSTKPAVESAKKKLTDAGILKGQKAGDPTLEEPREPESPWFALGKQIGRLGKTTRKGTKPLVDTAKKKLTDAGILRDPNAVDPTPAGPKAPTPEEPESPWFALGKRFGQLGRKIRKGTRPLIDSAKKKLTDAGILRDPKGPATPSTPIDTIQKKVTDAGSSVSKRGRDALDDINSKLTTAVQDGRLTPAEATEASRAIEERINELQRRYDELRASLGDYPETTRQWLLQRPDIMKELGVKFKE